MALTPLQENFINEYLVDFNATRAAERAGYKGNDNVLAVTGSDLLRLPKISELIKARLSDRAMTADEVLTRLAEQARGNMRDFVRFDDNGNPTFDLQSAATNGKLILAKKLKTKTRQWSEQFFNSETEEFDSRPVSEVTIELELYDAQAAQVHIGRHHKLFTDVSETKTEIEIIDATDPRERIASRIAGIAQRTGTDESPERPDDRGSDGA